MKSNKKLEQKNSLHKIIGTNLSSDILYKKIVEHMNEGVWMGDKNERTIYANPKFCKMMGYSLEEMLGKESYEFWDEESARVVKETNISKRQKDISSSYEGNLLNKNGKKIPVLLSGTSLPDGGTIGIMTDLTELKKKEEAEKILSNAINHANDAIIVFDENGTITSWNNGAKVIFGYKKEEMMGEKLEKIFSVEELANFFKQRKGFYSIELKSKHKNEKQLVIDATLTTVITGDENSVFYLLIARDITHQTEFEEELASKYQKIQEAYNRFGLVRRQMDYIFEILDLLSSAYDSKSIADYIVSSLIMLTKTDACVLRIYNKEKNTLELVSSFGIQDINGKAATKYEGSLAQKAFEQKSPLKIVDLEHEPRYQSNYLAKKNNLSSLLLIPLEFQGELIGSLSLYANPEKKLSIFENEFVERYAKIIQIAIYTIFFKKETDN